MKKWYDAQNNEVGEGSAYAVRWEEVERRGVGIYQDGVDVTDTYGLPTPAAEEAEALTDTEPETPELETPQPTRSRRGLAPGAFVTRVDDTVTVELAESDPGDEQDNSQPPTAE